MKPAGLGLVFAACLAASTASSAQALAPSLGTPLSPTPAAPHVALEQRLGAALPLAATFTGSDGHALRLADEFAVPARPVILVLGYLKCPQLCGLLMHGLLESIHEATLTPADVRIVFVSIDPGDTPTDAAERRRVDLAYAHFLDPAAAPPSLDLLTGSPASIASLAQRVGDVYEPAAGGAYAHPAGIVVVTPRGRVSRYLTGVRFDAAELRLALSQARGDRIGTLTDRLALMCAHLDLRAGVHSADVMAGVRAVALGTLLALGLFVWRRRAREPMR